MIGTAFVCVGSPVFDQGHQTECHSPQLPKLIQEAGKKLPLVSWKNLWSATHNPLFSYYEPMNTVTTTQWPSQTELISRLNQPFTAKKNVSSVLPAKKKFNEHSAAQH